MEKGVFKMGSTDTYVIGSSRKGKSVVKEYVGHPGRDVVYVDDSPLSPRLDICNHAADGVLSWGYCGSGCAQFALAVMVSEYGEDLSEHPIHYQKLKEELIAAFDMQKPIAFKSTHVWAIAGQTPFG